MSYSQKTHKIFMKSYYPQALVILLTTSYYLLLLLVNYHFADHLLYLKYCIWCFINATSFIQQPER